jgi:predicted HNH restriction endonuclease
MPYADPQKNRECKHRRYERNKTFRRRVKKFVGCQGTLTDKCRWEGVISHVALQFDHREGEIKTINICRMDGHSIESIKIEMRKCDVVCANCHAIRTEQRRLQ